MQNLPLIVHVISSMRRGGRERQLATIFKYSEKEIVKSKIVSFNRVKENYLDEYDISEDDIYYLKTKNPLLRFFELKKIIQLLNPDIIFTWGSFEFNFCFFLSPFIKSKIINGSIRHGIVLFNQKQITRYIFLHLSKYIVANSKAGLRANKLRKGYVLYNGIDKKFRKPFIDERKKSFVSSIFNRYENELVLISVANLVPYKDYFTVLKALSDIKKSGGKFIYIAVGEGPMRKQIEEEVEKLELKVEVRFVGRQTNVEDYLSAGDIFIHSSKGEGCSNAILEAMMASLPIIASDTGGTSEITGSENGKLFQYQNVDQLTKAIKELMSDRKILKKKAEKSSSIIAERFTVEKMMVNYFSILEEISGLTFNEKKESQY